MKIAATVLSIILLLSITSWINVSNKIIDVSSERQLQQALQLAKPGDEIIKN